MQSKSSHSAGIGIVGFMLAIAISMGYYQFVYLPEANAKPLLPRNVLEPKELVRVTIVEGAWQDSTDKTLVPKIARGILGLSNKILWTNMDSIGHTVTTKDDYVDIINGRFDSNDRGKLIMPGQSFEFTFTRIGEYPYSCVPHPHMSGVIQIVEILS